MIQILELTDNLVLALNMMDQIESKGMKIDVQALSEQLDIPVVPTVVLKKEGIHQLIDALMEIHKGKCTINPVSVMFEESIEQSITELEPMVVDSNYPSRWLAIKLLKGDAVVKQILKKRRKFRSCRDGRDITGFFFAYPAKELSLLYLGLLYGVGKEAVTGFMGSVWTPLQALSCLVFLTLYAPCLSTVAVMVKEIGWKWTLMNMVISLAAGFGSAGSVYWLRRLPGNTL